MCSFSYIEIEKLLKTPLAMSHFSSKKNNIKFVVENEYFKNKEI